MKYTDEEGNEWEEVTSYAGVANENIVIKPVKKTENKEAYRLVFYHNKAHTPYLVEEDLILTPTTANKLSEFIAAAVEYVTEKSEMTTQLQKERKLMLKANEATESFQESQ